MEEKNISENEQNDKKSWLEEQLQKRNINQSEDTFSFKEDKDIHSSVQDTADTSLSVEANTDSVKTNLTETQQNQQNISDSEEVKHTETVVVFSDEINTNSVKSENTKSTETEQNLFEADKNEVQKPVTDTQKEIFQSPVTTTRSNMLSKLGQKKLFGQVTVKKAVPYTFGGIVFLFLVFNLRYMIFNENKVPTLHTVNVKDTLLSDISVTKVLDPANPDRNDKKNPKKQEKLSNNNEKNEVKQNKETSDGRTYYKIKQGDKFNDIARKYGLTPAELKELNPKVRPERIQPGQKLRVKKQD